MRTITDKHELEQVQAGLLPRLINDWALVTAGTIDDYNTMTIAWGGFGDIWWVPTISVWVVPTRYTYQYLEREDTFTVQFFGPDHKADLQLLGSKSGRDGDKVAETSLTPQALGAGVTFAEADVTLVCRKLYSQPLDPQAIPAEVMGKFYTDMGTHTHFIGQILEAHVAD